MKTVRGLVCGLACPWTMTMTRPETESSGNQSWQILADVDGVKLEEMVEVLSPVAYAGVP